MLSARSRFAVLSVPVTVAVVRTSLLKVVIIRGAEGEREKGGRGEEVREN